MAPARILYVEDNDDNIFMLSLRLERMGYEVEVARDGADGVAKAAEILPDLIIMDMGLPVIDGWEATRRIKATPELAATPIIALTGFAMQGEEERAIAAGCDAYDSKPVEFKRLAEKIRTLLDRRDG